MSINSDMVRNIVEGALLAAGEPVSFERLLALFDEGEGVGRSELKSALADLEASMAGRGLELKEVGSGWRMQVREDLAPWISRLWEQRPPRYTRALLETLAVIAYQQPVTRSDIEQVRGVSVSSNIVKTLLERDWIRILGHRDVPGRPALYGTTRGFLDYFNLRALDELPPLAEIRDLDKINEELGFDGVPGDDEAGASAAVEDRSDDDATGREASGEEREAPVEESDRDDEPEAMPVPDGMPEPEADSEGSAAATAQDPNDDLTEDADEEVRDQDDPERPAHE